MNPKPISETESIRSDIEMTRRRMDDTVDALGERLKGRHLVDEVIGFFRGRQNDGADDGPSAREKISQTASTAVNAVVDTVKQNPMPVLLIAAGAAWLAYSSSRDRSAEIDTEFDEEDRYDPDTHYDRPLEYPNATTGLQSELGGMEQSEGSSKLGEMKENLANKASETKEQIKNKLSNLGDATRGRLDSIKHRASEMGAKVRDRASELGSQVQERSRVMYTKTRDQVSRTAEQHPLELGLGCLAVGVLVGLALPTPNRVNQMAGPAVDRLRNRTKQAGRDMVQKGKDVVQAATNAAKQEAEHQGLTMQGMRQNLGATAETAALGGQAQGSQEGCSCDVNPTENKTQRNDSADPSSARPAM